MGVAFSESVVWFGLEVALFKLCLYDVTMTKIFVSAITYYLRSLSLCQPKLQYDESNSLINVERDTIFPINDL